MTDIPDWAFEEADKHFIPVQTEVSVEAVRKVIARAIMAATERATEQAIAACERQKAIFSTNEYATPQPIGGLMERFACDQCIAEIRRNDIPQASNSNFKSVPHMGPVA